MTAGLSILAGLFLIFSVTSFCGAEKVCTILTEINGCSTPLNLNIPFKSEFTPACNGHDICYRCGAKYGWNQKVCDTSFHNQMLSICDKLKDNNHLKTTRVKRGIKEFIQNAKDKIKKYTDGWIKATKNQTATDEAKRLLGELQTISKLIVKWSFIHDNHKSCKHAAEIYYKTVIAFGVYHYRVKSVPSCDETCAKQLGKPSFNTF